MESLSSENKESVANNSEEASLEETLPTYSNADAICTTVSVNKINVLLKATSDVPIMKKSKWRVDENKTIHQVVKFLKKALQIEDKDTLFLYVSQAFAPSPDQQIKNLYDCFGSEGKLVLHYSKTPTWG